MNIEIKKDNSDKNDILGAYITVSDKGKSYPLFENLVKHCVKGLSLEKIEEIYKDGMESLKEMDLGNISSIHFNIMAELATEISVKKA